LTLNVLHAIWNLTYKSDPQNPLWRNFILDEVSIFQVNACDNLVVYIIYSWLICEWISV
jgi:hypothetical protein